jgi:predicted RNA binding protein YcfA (HicA-like mRNA interferase family)
MPPVPAVRGERVVRALERAGFKVARVTGSHYVMRHPDGRGTTVPYMRHATSPKARSAASSLTQASRWRNYSACSEQSPAAGDAPAGRLGRLPDRQGYDQLVQAYGDVGALIDDPRVLAVRMLDSGEPFVDLSSATALAVDQNRTDVQQLSDDLFHVRSGVADRLARAQACLPDGYRLQLKEGWRPIWVQERLWHWNLDRLRDRRPDLTDEELHQENARLVAPPGTAPPQQHRRRC